MRQSQPGRHSTSADTQDGALALVPQNADAAPGNDRQRLRPPVLEPGRNHSLAKGAVVTANIGGPRYGYAPTAAFAATRASADLRRARTAAAATGTKRRKTNVSSRTSI